MMKYIKLLRFELKNIIREPMTMIMLLYPLLMIGIGAFVIPTLIGNYADSQPNQELVSLVVIVVFSNIAPFVTAAMLGFNLLDHKDENTLDTIRVTPLSLRGYVTFKAFYAYLISVNASFWSLQGTKLLSGDNYTFGGVNLWELFELHHILIYALVAGLFTPVFGLILSAFARNKIEGFAFMKISGIIALLPVLIVLEGMQDFKQYFLGVFPTFWSTKGLMVSSDLLSHQHNISVVLYMIIGIGYSLTLTILSYHIFENRLNNK